MSEDVEAISHHLSLEGNASHISDTICSATRRAVSSGSTSVVRFLLENGHASPNQIRTYEVAKGRSLDMVQLLLEHGWDIDTPQPGHGYVLLQ